MTEYILEEMEEEKALYEDLDFALDYFIKECGDFNEAVHCLNRIKAGLEKYGWEISYEELCTM